MGCPGRMRVYLHALFEPSVPTKPLTSIYLLMIQIYTQSLESVVNEELRKVCKWLNTNKLSLNTSKSNFVIFHPFQRNPDYIVTLKMYDNDLKILTSLEQKHYVKYLGVLIDSHHSWRYHIDYISSKISKGVGIIARLTHFVPTSTLLKLYRSLIEPHISYRLIAWVQV